MTDDRWCVRCFKRPDEPAGEKCGNPTWHTGHTCVPREEGGLMCRWCGKAIPAQPEAE